MTEILLNDAEVERSAAASEMLAAEAGCPGDGGSGGGGGGGEAGGRQPSSSIVGAPPQFRSRRVSPGRICPVPALLGSTVVDTDGRVVGGKGSTVLVSICLGHGGRDVGRGGRKGGAG